MEKNGLNKPQEGGFKRELGLFNAVSIIGGIMIGSGVFYVGSFVLDRVNLSPGLAIIAWIIAGLFSMVAGLCYAELGAAMPSTGGTYFYLSQAYGPLPGFMLGWTDLFATQTGTISALALGFVTYLTGLLPFEMSDLTIKLVASGLIVIFTVINIIGVKEGGWVQNLLMVAKLVPIFIIIVAGFALGKADNPITFTLGEEGGSFLGHMALAIIAALWAYDGFSAANIVAEEIKEPQKNLPRAMMIAVFGVIGVYVLFNLALMRVLPAAEIAADENPASKAAFALFGTAGGRLVTIGALISILGALNGCLLSYPREYYAMARDKKFFSVFGKLHPKFRTPINSQLLNMGIAILLLFSGTFEQLTTLVVFTGWVFYTMGIIAVFVLRKKYPDLHRPYKVFGYPVVPALAVCISFTILLFSLLEDPSSALLGVMVPLSGIPAYFIFKTINAKKAGKAE